MHTASIDPRAGTAASPPQGARLRLTFVSSHIQKTLRCAQLVATDETKGEAWERAIGGGSTNCDLARPAGRTRLSGQPGRRFDGASAGAWLRCPDASSGFAGLIVFGLLAPAAAQAALLTGSVSY